MKDYEVDVLIVGGGTGGTAAAVSSRAMGQRVLVVEEFARSADSLQRRRSRRMNTRGSNPPAAPRLTAISGTGFAIITAKTGN